MIPVLDKNSIRVITQAIEPEHAEYVAGIKDIMNDVATNYPEFEENDCCEDIIYVIKIMAFADKFRALHWAAKTMDYHKTLDDFCEELEEYKDEIAENIQSIIGQFDSSKFTKLELPVGDNPLDIINELKICVANWFNLHIEDMEYEGCRNATSDFIQTIHKYVYLFRLCKLNQA